MSIDDLTLSDVLTRMSTLDEEIKQVGINKANIQKVRALIEEYDELETALEEKRKKQFWDTAYDFLMQQKIAGAKNNTALAKFLRRFAIHVIREFAQQNSLDITIMQEHVDAIGEMLEDEPVEE